MINRSNISKLRVLTESLIDRDFLRSKVLSLFDSFCNDFPIPMDAWIADSDLNVLTSRSKGKGLKKNISDFFEGDAKEKNIEMHKKAASGEIVTYVIQNNDTLYLTKLMPSESKPDLIFGISMDVTVFSNSFNAIDHHCKDVKDCEKLNSVRNTDLYDILKKETEVLGG